MIRTIALLTCLPGLAAAQTACPTAADLALGIRVDRAGGYTEVYRSGSPGVILVQGMIDRQLEYTLKLANGLQLLSFSGNVGPTPDSGLELTYDYGLPLANLPGPVPGGGWQSPATLTTADGVFPEPQFYAFGPLEQLTIGACTYDMITVNIAYQNDANTIETVQFMPDLGFGVLVYQDDNFSEPTDYAIQRIGLSK